MSFKERLTSRKFLMALGAALAAVSAALSGQMEWREAILAVLGSVVSYMFAESWVDAKRAAASTDATITEVKTQEIKTEEVK